MIVKSVLVNTVYRVTDCIIVIIIVAVNFFPLSIILYVRYIIHVFLYLFPLFYIFFLLQTLHMIATVCSEILVPSTRLYVVTFQKNVNSILHISVWPVPVAARSKAWVCGRSSAETVGSNPTGGMDVCLL